MSFYSSVRAALLLLFLSATSAFAADSPETTMPQGPRILALGDSMIAWHSVSKNSIADALAETLGEPVENRAIGGARIIYGLPITGAMGMKISKQYRGDDVDWVVLNGGGNDLWLGCGCGACDRKMARMISQNGTRGEIPKLVRDIRKTGARVIYLGYLRSPGVESVIDACRVLGDDFEVRLSHMATALDGVYFLDVSDLVPSGDRSFHGVDMIHPSRKASRIIGQKLAQIIQTYD
ncbi:SGNH/GDSL hydrolase family protein [uncultured Celeribacter sp.]|uniref:SGNH/GDSL hydrolase family protein n=1 Tax=uncultured Celeribacter sp. TaxID=1303376 RepID=UPI002AA643C8|nr:SGNH/GDSL hydrolase family protein [uncultured Celeribacter sp.]